MFLHVVLLNKIKPVALLHRSMYGIHVSCINFLKARLCPFVQSKKVKSANVRLTDKLAQVIILSVNTET